MMIGHGLLLPIVQNQAIHGGRLLSKHHPQPVQFYHQLMMTIQNLMVLTILYLMASTMGLIIQQETRRVPGNRPKSQLMRMRGPQASILIFKLNQSSPGTSILTLPPVQSSMTLKSFIYRKGSPTMQPCVWL